MQIIPSICNNNETMEVWAQQERDARSCERQKKKLEGSQQYYYRHEMGHIVHLFNTPVLHKIRCLTMTILWAFGVQWRVWRPWIRTCVRATVLGSAFLFTQKSRLDIFFRSFMCIFLLSRHTEVLVNLWVYDNGESCLQTGKLSGYGPCW